jgi:ribonuclease T2
MIGPWRRVAPSLLLLVGLLSACAPSGDGDARPPAEKSAPAVQASNTVPRGSGFDFYVLALSWSPSYCEAEGESANRQQCGASRPYAFVVHGLWPQFERGYPQNCAAAERDVPGPTVRKLLDIMPSSGLIRHQWQKHGSCSGLTQGDYFDVLRAAREKIVVPADFARLDAYRTLSPADAEKAFLDANPGLRPDGVSVTCDRRYLREVRICMTKDLGFRACDEVDRRSCRAQRVVMPPVRGG